MLTPQFPLPLADALIVDNFAGGGGASTGIERAIGRPVDIAINHDPEAVAMHTLPTKDRMGLVTVHGQDYVIADIGMRMLQPRELARAQGFGDSYLLEAPHLGRPLPKHAQVRMIGNSVCPPMAEALVRANYSERQVLREAA